MENEIPHEDRQRSQRVASVLNASGFPFHYAVLRDIGLALDQRRSLWRFEAAEFPVRIRGESTRIDILLSHTQRDWLLIGECKRPNPSLRQWCFFRAPFVRRNRGVEMLNLETLSERQHGVPESRGRVCAGLPDAYHIALEIKGGGQGENSGLGRGLIEQAATQVMRGTAGLAQFYAEHNDAWGQGRTWTFVPVIFTAATLYASTVNLNEAETATGDIRVEPSQLRQVPWLFYQYHISPDLRPDLPGNSFGLKDSLGDVLDREYVRTIAVVSPSGISDFLQWISHVGPD